MYGRMAMKVPLFSRFARGFGLDVGFRAVLVELVKRM
jgi:hypothetical protein